MHAHDFLNALSTYCTLTSASVTSYFRTKSHNEQIGGVHFSPHLYWLGADVIYDRTGDSLERKEIAHRLGLLMIAEKDHDHLQPLDWKAG